MAFDLFSASPFFFALAAVLVVALFFRFLKFVFKMAVLAAVFLGVLWWCFAGGLS